jgi:hypothetical protein
MHLILVLTVVGITGCQVPGTVQLRGSTCCSLVFCITWRLASVFLVLHIALLMQSAMHMKAWRTYISCDVKWNHQIWKLILVKLTETYITSIRCRYCGLGFIWEMNEGVELVKIMVRNWTSYNWNKERWFWSCVSHLKRDMSTEFCVGFLCYTGRFIMFSVITNIYNKKTKGPTLMELFTATGKLKKVFFYN